MNTIFAGLTKRELEVFKAIHKNGPVTKGGLIKSLNIKLSTLNRAMDALIKRKLIVESGMEDSSGGRRPSEYDVVTNDFYFVGADISRTYTNTVITNFKNQILAKRRFFMDAGVTPERCAERIAADIDAMAQELAADKSKIIGMGVGTVGPMDREKGILFHPKGFLNASWDNDVPLKELLRQKTNLSCEIDNGANTAALLEYHFGTGRGCRCVVYINCGVGIRSAVVRDGEVLRTMNDAEDAFAQMTMDINGGYLEDYSSLEAVRCRYSKSAGRTITYDELFAFGENPGEPALEAFGFSAGILGMGISNLAKLLNPDVVILSGPLVSKFEPYFKICEKTFREHSGKNAKTVFSRAGSFEDSVVAVGAGLMFIEKSISYAQRKD